MNYPRMAIKSNSLEMSLKNSLGLFSIYFNPSSVIFITPRIFLLMYLQDRSSLIAESMSGLSQEEKADISLMFLNTRESSLVNPFLRKDLYSQKMILNAFSVSFVKFLVLHLPSNSEYIT